MKKKIGIIRLIIVAVVILILLGTVGINMFGSGAIEYAIEAAATKALNVGVELDDVDLSLFKGQIVLRDMKINNPAGYQHKNLIDMRKIDVAIKPKSLISDNIKIKHIKLNGLTLVMEQKNLTNNLQDILGGMKTSSKTTKTKNKSGSTKSLFIKLLEINDCAVKIKLLPIPGKSDTVTMTLDNITMKNIGDNTKVDLAILSTKILIAITEGIAKQGAGVLPTEMLKSLDGQLENLSKMSEQVMTEANKAVDEVNKLAEGLGGLFDQKE